MMELLSDKGSSRRGSSNSNFSEIGPALCQLCSMSLWLLRTVDDVTRDSQVLKESHQRAPAKAGILVLMLSESCVPSTHDRLKHDGTGFLPDPGSRLRPHLAENWLGSLLPFLFPTRSIMPAGGGRSTTKITSQGQRLFLSLASLHVSLFKPSSPCHDPGVHGAAPGTDTAVAA